MDRATCGESGPFQNLFAPQHAHVIVNVTLVKELVLRGIPERVMRGGGFKFVQSVYDWAFIRACSCRVFCAQGGSDS